MQRLLTIIADDYGIGPETSRAIGELAREGRLDGTVMIVNTPTAEEAARQWLADPPDCDLGWHPNLTLDRPISDPKTIRSLVQPNGLFWPLPAFLSRVLTGRIRGEDVRREFAAQYQRFVDLIGVPPVVINSHQHVSVFPPCDSALLDVLDQAPARPYVRRVVEPWRTLGRVPGARIKRTFLSLYGSRAARRLAARGYPGSQTLAGVTDPIHVTNPDFWLRWFAQLQQESSVEICCHPGYADDSLLGRDVSHQTDLERRPDETRLLRDPDFRFAYARAKFRRIRPSALVRNR